MKLDKAALDRWITGNYGEDHPDNVDEYGRCVECSAIITEDGYVRNQCQECGEELE